MNSVVSLRVSDEEKQAWVAAAGSPRGLSRWLRQVANAAIATDQVSEREAGTPSPYSDPRPRSGCAVHDVFTPWCVDCQRERAAAG